MMPSPATASSLPVADVWLRGNVRPVLGLGAVAAIVGAGLTAAVFLAGAQAPGKWFVSAYWLVAAGFVAALAAAAMRPRLVHRVDSKSDNVLEVRLAPGAAHAVPLEVIECFFMGSQRLEPAEAVADDQPTHRVGTLVMRVAERAEDWQARPTFAPWGTWQDGAIVFDGRWCEPLSVELARRLSARLVDAKRAVAGSPPTAEHGR
ncbi:MAG: hypothetical protein ACK6DO_05485 [Planctomycetia bacterium]